MIPPYQTRYTLKGIKLTNDRAHCSPMFIVYLQQTSYEISPDVHQQVKGQRKYPLACIQNEVTTHPLREGNHIIKVRVTELQIVILSEVEQALKDLHKSFLSWIELTCHKSRSGTIKEYEEMGREARHQKGKCNHSSF